jgi:hypothetical protein
LRPVTGVTKLNPSIFSKVFLNFFSLLIGVLESFLGSCQSSSCQHALSNFFLYWYMNSVICDICNSVKMSSFLLWSQRVYPAVLLRERISADITWSRSLSKTELSKKLAKSRGQWHKPLLIFQRVCKMALHLLD